MISISNSISDGHQIAGMMKSYGKPIMKLLIALINRQAEFYNVRKEMTEAQAAMIAQTLVDEYGVENIEDVVLMFKMARAGNFGTIYGKLDGETIMGWMALYLDRKYEEIERQHQNAKFNATEIHPDVLQAVKEAVTRKVIKENRPVPGIGFEVWIEHFETWKEDYSNEELMETYKVMEANNIFGHYDKQIKWIADRLPF